MSLTDEERVRIRHHLGYLNVAQSETYVLGVPAAMETQFIIEGAMNRVLAAAEPMIRKHLGILDTIENQMVEDLELLAVEQVDEIRINADEMKKLRREYRHWQNGLANLVGTYPNPFDKRFEIGGVNVPVRN